MPQPPELTEVISKILNDLQAIDDAIRVLPECPPPFRCTPLDRESINAMSHVEDLLRQAKANIQDAHENFVRAVNTINAVNTRERKKDA